MVAIHRESHSVRMAKIARVIELAGQPDGVSAADVKRQLYCSASHAATLLVASAVKGELHRARSAVGKYHYFQGRLQRDDFMRRVENDVHATIVRKREAKAARQRQADALAAMKVYERAPRPDRVDIMADPLPGVPGWRSGPVIRAGALDYTRHQAGHGTTLAGALR